MTNVRFWMDICTYQIYLVVNLTHQILNAKTCLYATKVATMILTADFSLWVSVVSKQKWKF